MRGTQVIRIETSAADDTTTGPETVQAKAQQGEVSVGKRDSVDSGSAQNVEHIVVSDTGPTSGTSGVVQLQIENISGTGTSSVRRRG